MSKYRKRSRLSVLYNELSTLLNRLDQMAQNKENPEFKYFQEGHPLGNGMVALLFTLDRLKAEMEEELGRGR